MEDELKIDELDGKPLDPLEYIILGITYGMFKTTNPTQEQQEEILTMTDQFFKDALIKAGALKSDKVD